MPVTKLFVEGDLDEEILTGIFAGAPVVEKRGGKYGLQGMVLRERSATGTDGVHFLRDRDFDYEPPTSAPHLPTPIFSERTKVLVGWRWFRHSIECYLLEPAIAAAALGTPKEKLKTLIQQAGPELSSYQAARWAVGQARAKLPPSRHLETAPQDCVDDFRLPSDRSEQASWTWLSTTTREFFEPVAAAFAEDALRRNFDDRRIKFAAMGVGDILVWFSGKDVLSFIAPQIGSDSPKRLRNRLRNWVRNNPEEAVRLLPEWAELKRVVSE